jgi:hypothetical protein
MSSPTCTSGVRGDVSEINLSNSNQEKQEVDAERRLVCVSIRLESDKPLL